jgi:transglutaminase-like putative cysteine protease
MWKADVGIYLKSSNELKNSIKMKFPRHYRGGKNKNSYYTIFSTEGKELNENEIISNYTYLSVDIPGANTTKLGVDIHTAFTNKLSDKFDVYFPEKYYQIDENNIDKDIKTIAEQIINNKAYYPGKENYYKLGRFVNNYMTYDLRYAGMYLTPKEIYNLKAGVCEHFTILYNEMLNSIGIKTLYVSGWAFSNNETSGNKDTMSHAWTVALIDGNWIELDATWGLLKEFQQGIFLKPFSLVVLQFLGQIKQKLLWKKFLI